VGDLAGCAGALADTSAQSLVGIPVQVLALARYCRAKSIRLNLRSILLSTDSIPPVLEEELRRLWGCEIYQHYGMTEMGFGGAIDCDAHSGAHIRENDLIFEILGDDGTPLPDGETGEIAVNPDFKGASAVFDLPLDPSLADPEKAEAYLSELLDEEGSLKGDEDGRSEDSEVVRDEFTAKWEAIDWDSVEPISSTIQEIKADEDGILNYAYELESGDSGSFQFQSDLHFTDDPTFQSEIVYGSSSEGPDGETFLAVRVDKDENGKFTAMVLASPPPSST
jgi:acyl-CoA synthetase (AMP-forming)/AMP-acid ligase II